MINHIRKLRISLAAKCQLLFGAAVVLIISAALFVPWQRMEQLTAQIDEAAAHTLAEHAVKLHVASQSSGASFDPTLSPAMSPATQATSPAGGAEIRPLLPPRLLSTNDQPNGFRSSSFDRRALSEFQRDPDRKFYQSYFNRSDTPDIYRYAEPAYLRSSCLNCHDGGAPADDGSPSSRPARAKLLGIVSIDMQTQVGSGQRLLNRVFLMTAGLLAGTLAIATFYFITTRLILQPVRVLQETAEKVSEGDLNIRSDISTGDEFQQLSETFNTMLANLQESSDQLRAVNKGLDLKLNELAESNVALYESNRLKSEFLANVSHELRTPLNSILGFAELLKSSANNPDARSARYVQNIVQSGKNLLDLINDLLDLAKIEAGRMELRAEPLSLSDLFEGLTNILKPLTESRQLTINPSVAADVPIVHSDPAKLQQILYNFLSNSIKFSPDAGLIQLSARRDGPAHVYISVSDQGPGIDGEKQQLIFEKFRQIDGSVTRKHGGTGLGLAISRDLTILLGGKIGVDSLPGEGSVFWIRIPLKIMAGSQDLRKPQAGS